MFRYLLFAISFFIIPEECDYSSQEQEVAPIQTTSTALIEEDFFLNVTQYTDRLEFEGTNNSPAVHEGIDFINENRRIEDVPVYSVLAGKVVYVRKGCPEEHPFTRNNLLRECGSGWGNHVVIDHGQFFTRYAHLRPNTISVSTGNTIKKAEIVGLMGNSGRSNKRHLHFEVGLKDAPFDSCDAAQSFDSVTDPKTLGF